MAALLGAGYASIALEWVHKQWWLLLCYDPWFDGSFSLAHIYYMRQDHPTLWRAGMLIGFFWVMWTVVFLGLKHRMKHLGVRMAILGVLTVGGVILLMLAILARFEFELLALLLERNWTQLVYLITDEIRGDDRSRMDHSSYTAAVLAMTVIMWSTACSLVLGFRDYRIFRSAKLGLCWNCNYDLRGSTKSTTCPECGKPKANHGCNAMTGLATRVHRHEKEIQHRLQHIRGD